MPKTNRARRILDETEHNNHPIFPNLDDQGGRFFSFHPGCSKPISANRTLGWEILDVFRRHVSGPLLEKNAR